MALAHLGDFRGELRFGEVALLDEHLTQRVRRALEIFQLVIALAEIFRRAAQLIEANDLAAGQRTAERVGMPFPELHAVIDGVDRAAFLATHVVWAFVLTHRGDFTYGETLSSR